MSNVNKKDIAIKATGAAIGAVIAGPVGAGVGLAATTAIQSGTKK
jgi:hypothetical protein